MLSDDGLVVNVKAEVNKPKRIKLEVGEKYLLRNGQTIELIKYYPDFKYFRADNHSDYAVDDGGYYDIDSDIAFQAGIVSYAVNTKPITSTDMKFADEVDKILSELGQLLKEKNRKYGNSALEPQRIFSKQNATEQIKVRLDDKLSRLKNQQDDEDEDVVTDLMGYLVLLKISMKKD